MVNNKKIKILFIHHGSGQGGAVISLKILLNNLDSKKFELLLGCDFRYTGIKKYFNETVLRLSI